ncbi:putative ABC transport system ATP-binding protein [Natranaerovirga pectinivora]|uniref:Putative ABC transport system ATP-binding protein n=1 Tax=Natranaerovirga pectinivora TaxID=682400 RepID=A0A4R3MRK4_9FIRM|nr:ABC transporter ATP-binding protein [Natranaerovirga pectinivora]TCT17143.1 putative ABC transport system ATP-binding protein [Natranaerovirga pectinivora]
MNKEIVLEAIKLRKTYSNGELKVEALKNIDLTIYKGEMLAIMGASGSGKSTLLNLIGALDAPSDGTIKIKNRIISNYHKEPYATQYRSEYIGFIFQDYNLLKDLTVEENLALPLILMNKDSKTIKEEVGKYIDLVGLGGKEKVRPYKLSGGQQQRVAIARALITNPPLLLADEPTGNLDYQTSEEILNIIKDLQEALDQSIVIVTHDPQVATFADRVLFIHNGKIVNEYVKKAKAGDIDKILHMLKNSMRC